MHRYILHNGEIREAGDTCLVAGQVGLLSGWGVFSTFRVHSGVVFAFERHWARLSRDANLLRVPMPPKPEAVKAGLLELIRKNGVEEATLRLAIVRNKGGIWEGPGIGREFDVIALTADLKSWGRSVRLALRHNARYAGNMFSGAKMLSWAMNLVWVEEAQSRGFDEVVLLNERGEVSELTSANIFISEGDRIWTPPLASGCLPGITREVLLEEVHVPGLSVQEKVLYPSDLEAADEVFITSTTRELLPVDSIEGLNIRRVSDCSQRLGEAFGTYLDAYVARERDALAATEPKS